MPHLLSYRIGTLDQPHLPFAQIAEMGIQGLEVVWGDATTTAQAPLPSMEAASRALPSPGSTSWTRHARAGASQRTSASDSSTRLGP